MASLSVSLKPTILVALDEAVKATGISRSRIAENAISAYLAELQEDMEDAAEAEKISAQVRSGKMKTYSADEVYKELGL
jgi:metal-responsive CopG/Arc/MetJ family transcriptional regulator